MIRRCILFACLAFQAGCSTPNSLAKPRWELPAKHIAFRPICGRFRAPALQHLPTEGLVPVYLFGVNGASSDEINRMTDALRKNGFAVPVDGFNSINGVWILFAVGEGVLKTQPMADRLFNVMCSLQFEHVQLVHARYNSLNEKFRMT